MARKQAREVCAPFLVAEILSVITGRMLAPLARIHLLLDHLTGDALCTHQLGRASTFARVGLIEIFPDLAAIEVPLTVVGELNVRNFMRKVYEEHGATRSVPNLAGWKRRDPALELLSMRTKDGES